MPKLEITNMIMIQNSMTGEVVALDRVKSWCGIAFPGGHVEPGESIYDSAVREAKEETGLDVWNLKPCGLVYWYNNETSDKYFIHLYKTSNYAGKLTDSTDEGRIFWTGIDELLRMKLSPNFKNHLPLFLEDKYCEAYCSWNEGMREHIDLEADNPWGIIYR